MGRDKKIKQYKAYMGITTPGRGRGGRGRGGGGRGGRGGRDGRGRTSGVPPPIDSSRPTRSRTSSLTSPLISPTSKQPRKKK